MSVLWVHYECTMSAIARTAWRTRGPKSGEPWGQSYEYTMGVFEEVERVSKDPRNFEAIQWALGEFKWLLDISQDFKVFQWISLICHEIHLNSIKCMEFQWIMAFPLISWKFTDSMENPWNPLSFYEIHGISMDHGIWIESMKVKRGLTGKRVQDRGYLNPWQYYFGSKFGIESIFRGV